MKRTVDIYSAGCPICEEAIATVRQIACDSCEVTILKVTDPTIAARARGLGIRSVPAVVVDGRLAACCDGRGVEISALRSAGIGQLLG